jgi:GNAT superfamily N-acetyltransferase
VAAAHSLGRRALHPLSLARGVARAILARLEDAARAQGHTALYLHTGSAVGLYAPLGYAPLETIPADTGAGTLTLMRKAL